MSEAIQSEDQASKVENFVDQGDDSERPTWSGRGGSWSERAGRDGVVPGVGRTSQRLLANEVIALADETIKTTGASN